MKNEEVHIQDLPQNIAGLPASDHFQALSILIRFQVEQQQPWQEELNMKFSWPYTQDIRLSG